MTARAIGLRGSVGSTQPVWLSVSIGEKTSAGGVQVPTADAPPAPPAPSTLVPPLPALPTLPPLPALLLPAIAIAPALPAVAEPLIPPPPPVSAVLEFGAELHAATNPSAPKPTIAFETNMQDFPEQCSSTREKPSCLSAHCERAKSTRGTGPARKGLRFLLELFAGFSRASEAA